MTSSTGGLVIRAVTLRDVPAICEVHRGSDGPYPDPIECAIWVNHCLLAGRLCYVAEMSGVVVGHIEWTLGWEPDLSKQQLYLGMLQIHEDYRGRNVGRTLIEHGASIAVSHGCDRLRTIPDEGVTTFYLKCGFSEVFSLVIYRQAVYGNRSFASGWGRKRGIPERVVRQQALRIGLMQACSRHMWEASNRPYVISGENWQHPCLARTDGRAFAQLRYLTSDQAYVLAWAYDEIPLAELCSAAHQLGSNHGIDELNFVMRSDSVGSVFSGLEPISRGIVVERVV